MKEFPTCITDIFDGYLLKIKENYAQPEDYGRAIKDCITAAYGYGMSCGLGIASAATGTSVFSLIPMDNAGNPIINTFLNTAAANEESVVEFYKEDLGL